MFHIFYVNEGYMMVLEPSSLRLVLDLQKCIKEKAKIEVQEQVLFLASGESISSGAALASYMSVGSDTNPIYLIRRISIFERENFTSSEQEGINVFYKNWQTGVDKLDKCDKMPSSTIVNEYVKLAKYGLHVADVMFKFCGKIVNEHKHLQKGWLAVIRNLDDNASRIERRIDRLSSQADKLRTLREKGIDLLQDFESVLKTLSTIFISNQLLCSTPTFSSSMTTITESTYNEDTTSLYDWISSKDSAYSLDELVDYVKDHLEKTDDTDLRESKTNFEAVSKLVKKGEYREIRGIDKRLETLNARLRAVEEKHLLLRELAGHIMQPAQDISVNIFTYQRASVTEFSRLLSETYQIAVSFINSKMELLKNLCQRLAFWVQQAYERLNQANKRMVVFDEKYNGLRQRLDLVRQIKEAPIMYVTGVAEVIRREAFKKEFSAWISCFVEKCNKFITEENKIRSEFYAKLEKHFLRQFFYDMSDVMPNFCPTVSKFDCNLPNISILHLRNLRKNFPEMQELLNVTAPQIYSRLAVTNPNAALSLTQPFAPLGVNLRREESFFVPDQTNNIATMNQNFPSTNWLSEEHIDMSPANNFFMTLKQNMFVNSSSSLHIDTQSLTSPMELGSLSEFGAPDASSAIRKSLNSDAELRHLSSSTVKGSDPIAIPNSLNFGPKMETSSLTIREQISTESSRFGTPDDHMGSFGSIGKSPITYPSTLSPKDSNLTKKKVAQQRDSITDSLEIFPNQPAIFSEIVRAKCLEVNTDVAEISKFFIDLKESVLKLQSEVRDETTNNLNNLKSAFNETQNKYESKIELLKISDAEKLHLKIEELTAKYEAENKELRMIFEHERYLRKEKEKELDEQKRLSEKLNSEYLAMIKAKDDLHVDLLKVEQERAHLKMQLELNLSVDYFSIGLKTVEQFLNRDLTVEEVQQIKKDAVNKSLKKPDNLIEETNASSYTMINESLIRSNYEKAFRSKMEFIAKGIEDRKNKEIQMMREEIKTETRLKSDIYIKKLKEKIMELNDRLGFYESKEHNKSDSGIRLSDSSCSNQALIDLAVQTLFKKNTMKESCIVLHKKDHNEFGALQSSLSEAIDVDSIESTIMTDGEVDARIKNIVENSRAFVAKNDLEPPCNDCSGALKKQTEIIYEAEEATSEDEYECRQTVTCCEKKAQTMLRGHDFDFMFTLKNVHEGSSVLITWSKIHKCYMIFCKSLFLYFVRESSIRRMGIDTSEGSRLNWLFVIVCNIELCQIKKTINRYNLPINKRFYRASVSSFMSETISPTFLDTLQTMSTLKV